MPTFDIPNTQIAAAQIECLTAKLSEMLAVAKDVEHTLSNVDACLATLGQRPSVAASVGVTDGQKRGKHGHR